MTQRVKYLLLGGCAALWAILLVLRWIGEEPPQEVPLRFQTGQNPVALAVGGQSADGLMIKPFKVQGQATTPGPQKNIFSMGRAVVPENAKQLQVVKRSAPPVPAPPPVVVPPPPPVPPSPPIPTGPTPEELAAIAARQQHELLSRQAREQMVQYRYLGYADRDGRQQAFIGKGTEIYILQQGDQLDGKFLVAVIDPTVVVLRESVTNLEARIELKKNSSINPS
ncbi:MAG: hypothetical protein BVN28_04880 [Nitrospira sp. ST-bin4]|nr:MAG: hypothetical protein BVN28_04880 [Nitrospira sp. ST-bin4]